MSIKKKYKIKKKCWITRDIISISYFFFWKIYLPYIWYIIYIIYMISILYLFLIMIKYCSCKDLWYSVLYFLCWKGFCLFNESYDRKNNLSVDMTALSTNTTLLRIYFLSLPSFMIICLRIHTCYHHNMCIFTLRTLHYNNSLLLHIARKYNGR